MFGKPLTGYPIMETKPSFKTVYPPGWNEKDVKFNNLMSHICKQIK